MLRLLCALVLLALPSTLAAQQPSPEAPQQRQPPSEAIPPAGLNYSLTTVVGCLSGNRGSYTLGAENGDLYRLSGDKSFLRRHVGQLVRVTGTPSAPENPASEATPNAGVLSTAPPVLNVSKIEKIADTCGGGR
jgi:hypothetical protein